MPLSDPATPGVAPERVPIAVGVIMDSGRRRVLLSRRPAHLRHGGLWEFPGGKQEPGELPEQALRRELHEELDLRVVAARPGLRIAHDYPDLRVELHVWFVTGWTGNARGREGQELEWVPVDELGARAFPEANRRIVTTLQLPPVYLVTPDLDTYEDEFFAAARAVLAAGIAMLQFRSRKLAVARRARVMGRLAVLCREYGATLLINGTAQEALAAGAGGLHLSASRQLALAERPVPGSMLLGVSCHDAAELVNAERLGADFAVLGPVAPTHSHPGRAPLGWPEYGRLVGEWPRLPVYAVGGIGAEDMPAVRASGAWGAAMISAVWSAGDPGAAAGNCLRNAARVFRG
jgi:8-oxo-dGTP diphosphatase